MLIAALFTIAKIGNQLSCPSTDNWIKKMWYTYAMEYHSAINKMKIQSFAAMDLEDLLLSEISQAQNVKFHMSSFTHGS
jgi:hypothetical protein